MAKSNLDGVTPNLDMMARALIGQPKLYVDEGINSSNKLFHVPVRKSWDISFLWVELTSSADSGTRHVEIHVLDTDHDVVMEMVAGTTQIESLTRKYLFAPGVANLTSFRSTDWLTNPLPSTLHIPEGFAIRVFDSAAIAAAADDMIVQILVAEHDIPITSDAGDFFNYAPGPEQLEISTFAAVLLHQVNVPSSPGAAQLQFEGFAPLIGHSMVPPAEQLEISLFAPTFTNTEAFDPGAESLHITLFAPTLMIG